MAVTIDTYYSSKVIEGSQPSNPSFPVGETPPVLNPPGSGATDAFVPYEGASRDVDLGANDLSLNALTLNPTPATIPTAQGSLYFDQDEETIAAILNGVTQKIGEDLFFQVKNQSGAIIPKGTSVRFDGVVGASGRIKVVPFLADGTYPSLYFVGILNEELIDGGDGKAYYGGKVRNIDTSAYAIGTILYCSTTVAGGFQDTAPIAPNNIISVAAVIAQSATVGTLLVRPQLGSSINYDEGVQIVDVQNGDILKYNEDTGLFENTPETGSTKDGLISGGLVQWTDTGFIFNVSRAVARFLGVLLDSLASSTVTLAAADPTNNRRDVFILQVGFDVNGIPISITPDKITGTASASPIKPQINPATQIELTDILVIAASTTPTLTTEVIYDENVEWVGSYTGTGTVVFNSAVNPFQGPFSIEATNIENGLKIRLTRGSDFDLSTVQTLGKQLDLKATMFAGQNIGVTFLDSAGAAISTELILNFDKSSTIYQFIGEALTQFTFTSFLARAIEFRYIRTKGATVHDGFYLDIIKLEGGINPPQTVGSFLGLTDTPSSYSGQASKVVSVKADESGLEFTTGGAGASTFLALTDTPSTYVAQANKFPRVNAGETALAFDTVSPYDLDQEGATDTQVLTWVAANSRYEPTTFAGSSNWTVIGSDIYRNSSVMIGSTSAPGARLHVIGLGSLSFGGSMATISSGSSPAAGNLYGIGIEKNGVELMMLGVNKNTVSGSVPANCTFISGFLSNTQLSLGRGNNFGLPSTSDIFINSTGNVGISNTNPQYKLDVSGSVGVFLSQNSLSSRVALFVNTFNNFDSNPTIGYPVIRLVRDGKSGASFASLADFGIARYENVSTNARTELAIKLSHGNVSAPDRDLLRIRSSGEFIYYDGSTLNTGTATGLKFGGSTTQKLSFWNKTPIIQPTTAITGATKVAGGGTPITDTDTFGGYTVAQLFAIAINTGLTA